MFQYMTPVDYMKTSMAIWSRTAEMQLEMMRMSMGLADSWTGGMMKPNPSVMQLFTPTGMSSKPKKSDAPATPAAAAATAAPKPAPKKTSSKTTAKAPPRKPARPVSPASSAKVVTLETPKAEAKPQVKEATPPAPAPKPKAAAPAPKAPAEATNPAPRRRAPSKPVTPPGMTEEVSPLETKGEAAAKPATGRRSAPKAKAAPTAPATESAPKPTTRRRTAASKPANATGTAAKKPATKAAAPKKDET